MNIFKSKNGLAGLIAIIIAVALIIGGGAYLLIKKFSGQKVAEIEKTIEDIGASIEDIGASIPKLDFSLSPLPDLNVSALNVAAPQLPVSNVFSAPSVNSDFSYKPDVNISVPSPQIDIQIPSIPTGVPSGGQPQIDCSQFASVPSCSFVGAAGSQAYEACKQCFPNK
jgi:hypothetical protein